MLEGVAPPGGGAFREGRVAPTYSNRTVARAGCVAGELGRLDAGTPDFVARFPQQLMLGPQEFALRVARRVPEAAVLEHVVALAGGRAKYGRPGL